MKKCLYMMCVTFLTVSLSHTAGVDLQNQMNQRMQVIMQSHPGLKTLMDDTSLVQRKKQDMYNGFMFELAKLQTDILNLRQKFAQTAQYINQQKKQLELVEKNESLSDDELYKISLRIDTNSKVLWKQLYDAFYVVLLRLRQMQVINNELQKHYVDGYKRYQSQGDNTSKFEKSIIGYLDGLSQELFPQEDVDN